MSDVKKIGEYNIKDAAARESLESIGNTVSDNTSSIEAMQQSISNVNTNIDELVTNINQKGTVISNLTSRVESLESKTLNINYDAATETITFS